MRLEQKFPTSIGNLQAVGKKKENTHLSFARLSLCIAVISVKFMSQVYNYLSLWKKSVQNIQLLVDFVHQSNQQLPDWLSGF